jgi:hypothetical protein
MDDMETQTQELSPRAKEVQRNAKLRQRDSKFIRSRVILKVFYCSSIIMLLMVTVVLLVTPLVYAAVSDQ